MLKVVNFFRGYLVVRVSGPFPERFLNVCARHGVAFWRLKRTDRGDYIARVRRQELEPLERLAARAMCSVRVERQVGMPFFLMRFARRYAFIAGMVLCIAAVWTASLRLWEFRVEGCETIAESEVLSALEELGVGVGTLRRDVDCEVVATQMLLKLHDLRWIAVNMSGCVATVEVRERVPAPEMLDRSTPSNVVAARPGIVERVVALEGDPLVQPGATVAEGELLISGVRDMLNDKVGTSYGVNLVCARGEVFARTWYVLEAAAPLSANEKLYSGEKCLRRTLIVGKKRINLFVNSGIPFADCDKMVERTRLVLPGGLALPLETETAEYSEYLQVPAERDRAEVEAELRAALGARLSQMTGGQVKSTEFEFSEVDGLLTARMTAEVLEDIAKQVDIPGFSGRNTEDSE